MPRPICTAVFVLASIASGLGGCSSCVESGPQPPAEQSVEADAGASPFQVSWDGGHRRLLRRRGLLAPSATPASEGADAAGGTASPSPPQ
ncbi:MAG: hypothetical protein BGO98_49310 [Myxococcales bacterium 68-20]|nr:hypothetical protein [Myxococcales bacterium]OJY29819.1 MAG: hypothetical protein BGO98_49310 [Myxococcales bacterium 68-20]